MPPPPQHCAITIGNFDGVHRGHVALVQTARRSVGDDGRVVVLSFDPHPATILRPQAVPGRLSAFQQRTKWLRQAGADDVVAVRPSREFFDQSPNAFLQNLTKQYYSPKFIVEGKDFRFGRGRAGSIDTLRELERVHGYRTIIVDAVETALCDQSVVAVGSTLIRWMLLRGRVRDAAMLLGRPYELVATVVPGDRRGRTIGVLTVNLEVTPGGCMLPADGIYSGLAQRPDGAMYPAAISVGTKPTFGNNPRLCEAHLLGYHGPVDDYGWNIRLEFHDWLRDQLKYNSVDLLIEQLKRDIQRVRTHQTITIDRNETEAAPAPGPRQISRIV